MVRQSMFTESGSTGVSATCSLSLQSFVLSHKPFQFRLIYFQGAILCPGIPQALVGRSATRIALDNSFVNILRYTYLTLLFETLSEDKKRLHPRHVFGKFARLAAVVWCKFCLDTQHNLDQGDEATHNFFTYTLIPLFRTPSHCRHMDRK